MKKTSLYALLIVIVFITFYRILNVNVGHELSWDVLGYYLPLPSTFIHHDPLLNDISWLKELNQQKHLTGTLYMLSTNDAGDTMYFFFLGMSILYLPFFFLGNLIASIGGYPLDGFSPPYEYAMVIGAIFYTIVGLYFFRKNLLHFFSENIAALVILISVFTTNYIHHMTLKDLETVNVLFMLISIILWYTIKWHKAQKQKYLIFMFAAVTLTAMVKPSEIVVILIPLLWNVSTKKEFQDKIQLLIKNWKQFVTALVVAIVIVSPQLIYWIIMTGSIYYDTYKNPGVGLDIFSPHIIDALFSFRKGWLLYTPVMIFYIWGLVLMYKKNKKIGNAILIYLSITFYIIVSWTEWWYGAAFSNRPILSAFPVLALGLGYFFEYIKTKKKGVKIVVAMLILVFTFLNQFQWWQTKNYILDPYRTTKAYYFATFLRTKVTDEQRKLLLVERSFSNDRAFTDKDRYQSKVLLFDDFEKGDDGRIVKGLNNNYLEASGIKEFFYTKKYKFNELTQKDHVWIIIEFKYKSKHDGTQKNPLLITTMNRSGGNYGYRAYDINYESNNREWKHYKMQYLTPEIRDDEDEFLVYFWNRDKVAFDIDDFKITVYEREDHD